MISRKLLKNTTTTVLYYLFFFPKILTLILQDEHCSDKGCIVSNTDKPFDGGMWATGQLTLQVVMFCLCLE